MEKETISIPYVSVILPTFNRANLLNRSIQSVLNQTYRNFELIVVDDCSTDSTESVVKSFKDHRIKYIRHAKNNGAVIARNTGINAARGEYIAFQDSDDEWLPDKLERQIDVFNFLPRNFGVVYTSFWLVDRGKKTLVPPLNAKDTDGNLHDILLEFNFITTPAAVVRKECFKKVGLFENLPRLQEWALWLRISKYFYFRHINEPLVIAYRQPDSISRNVNAFIISRKYLLNKYFVEISKKPKLLSKHYFDIGTLISLNGDVKRGRIFFLRAIKTYPYNSKLLLSMFLSVFGQKIYNIIFFYLNAKGQKF